MTRAWMIVYSLLAVAGIALSAVSLDNHYAATRTGYCAVSETFDCDLVNRSEYASVFGVPVAMIGVAGYGLLWVLGFERRKPLGRTLLAMSAAGAFAFSLYLTYIEVGILRAYCILCLGSLALITCMTLMAAWVNWRWK